MHVAHRERAAHVASCLPGTVLAAARFAELTCMVGLGPPAGPSLVGQINLMGAAAAEDYQGNSAPGMGSFVDLASEQVRPPAAEVA